MKQPAPVTRMWRCGVGQHGIAGYKSHNAAGGFVLRLSRRFILARLLGKIKLLPRNEGVTIDASN